MISRDELVQVYTEIAGVHERRGQGQMRDRFLVLAADAALNAGQPAEAEKLRQRLLLASPHHLLKPFATFAQAVQAPDLLAYVEDLRKNYPPKTAVDLLAILKRQDDEAPDRPGTAPGVDLEKTLPPSTAPEPPIYKIRGNQDDTARQSAALPVTMPPGTRPPAFSAPGALGGAKASNPPGPRMAVPAAAGPAPAARSRPAKPGNPVAPAPWPTPLAQRGKAGRARGEAGLPAGSWLAALLFGILFTGGVLLLGYLLARPFL